MNDYPDSPWSEEALNGLATDHIMSDSDDYADTVFRHLLRSFPRGRYAERAAWKVGWRAYRASEFADAAEVFDGAAARAPRADNRPAWLYWSGRAYERLNNHVTANARYRLVVADYQNSYYGRLASGILKAKKETPVLARIGGATPVASIAGVEPTPSRSAWTPAARRRRGS